MGIGRPDLASWDLNVVMTTFTSISAFARRRDRVITGEELRRFGCSPAAIRHLVSTGRVWRVHRDVFALDGPLTARGVARAAVARTAPRSAAGLLTAAFLSDYVDRPPRIPQVITAREIREPAGIELRRSSTLARADVHNRLGYPVTAPARTIIDCARLVDATRLKAIVRRAEHHGLDLATLDRPGIPKALRTLLELYVVGSGLTANELEARFFELCATAGIPMPVIQRRLRGRVDFAWPDHGLIVETDGRQTHDTFIAFTDDRVRDRAHVLAGYTTLRFTWAEVEHRPQTVIADLLAFFSRR